MRTSLFILAATRGFALQCPPTNFSSIDNFDLDTFISARWYIQQQQPVSYLPKTENYCVYAEYAKKDRKSFWGYDISVHNHAEDVATPHKVHDSGSFICAKIIDAKTGKLEVAPCFLPTFASGPYWVLAYEEEQGYALISGGPPKVAAQGGCRTGTGVNGSGLWIFTRKQKKDPALIEHVREIAKQKGFDLSVLNDVDQSHCSTESSTPSQIMV